MAAGDNLKGTSVAAPHIGQRSHDMLKKLIDDKGNDPVAGAAFGTLGAETANARAVPVTVTDFAGNAVEAAVRLHARVYDANMDPVASAVATITATTGTAVTTDAQAGLLVDTVADGTVTLTVTDATAALVGSLWLGVSPVDRVGPETFVEVPFT